MYQNDHVNTVRLFLIHYREYSMYIENTKADIQDLQNKMTLVAAPRVPGITAAPGSAGNTTSEQERYYFEKESIPCKIQILEKRIEGIAPMINRISRSLEALNNQDRSIITRRMIDRESWIIIASDLHVSISFCQRRLPKILEILTAMIFGPDVILIQGELDDIG